MEKRWILTIDIVVNPLLNSRKFNFVKYFKDKLAHLSVWGVVLFFIYKIVQLVFLGSIFFFFATS